MFFDKKGETIMMQAQRQYTIGNFFGAYVRNTIIVPGMKETEDEKKREKELFEIVEDYIEQA